MNTTLLTNALNDCIDRLADGHSIDQCLRAYPELADELRPLLEIGLASSQNRADAHELSQMRSRLDTQIEALIVETDFDSPTPFRLPQGVMVLVASLVLVVMGGLALFTGENIPVGSQVTETVTITPEITDEVIMTLTPMPTCSIPTDWEEYRVQSDDSLSVIALNSGSTIKELREANCLDDNQTIVEGQLIFVPRLWETSQEEDDDDDDNSDSGSDDDD